VGSSAALSTEPAAGSSAFDYARSPWWDFDLEGRSPGAAAKTGAFEDG
jgi:hypothetical protein